MHTPTQHKHASQELLDRIPKAESTRRSLCVEACLSRLSDSRHQHLLLAALTDAEYQILQKKMGHVAARLLVVLCVKLGVSHEHARWRSLARTKTRTNTHHARANTHTQTHTH